MVVRCIYPTRSDYKWYSGKGVTVCAEWRHSFSRFLADMGSRPSLKHSLDRLDSGGRYSIENCRWATRSQQARNRRSRIPVKIVARIKAALAEPGRPSMRKLASRFGISPDTVRRIAQRAACGL